MYDLDPNYEVSRDPVREAQLNSNAWKGLESADLAPLAELLRSEFEIHPTMRSAIAAAIDGVNGPCFIRGQRLSAGKPIDDRGASNWRDLRIDAFVRARTSEFGSKEAAVAEAKEKFGLGRSAVFTACERAEKLRAKFPEKMRRVMDSNFKKFDQE